MTETANDEALRASALRLQALLDDPVKGPIAQAALQKVMQPLLCSSDGVAITRGERAER